MRIEYIIEHCGTDGYWRFSGEWTIQELAEKYFEQMINEFPNLKFRIVERKILCSYNPN
jgi:hypothetical protein